VSEQKEALIAEWHAARKSKGLPPAKPVENGAGGGDSGGMDIRIANLEADMKDVRKDLTDIKVQLSGLSAKIDLLVAKVPSWWQAPVGVGGLIALIATLIGIGKSLHWI